MDSKVTSKTSSLKALLLTAWAERWTDLQWGIHIKTILPRGVSGDVYNLADIIFQQALTGSGPNQLMLSFLKHSLSSQLISYAAVVLRISKFRDFHKPYCVIYLHNLIDNIQEGITCRSKQEEGLLPVAVLSLVNWLVCCYYYHLTNVSNYKESLAKKSIELLHKLIENRFILALLYLSKHENRDSYDMLMKKCIEVESYIIEKNLPNVQYGIDVLQLLRDIAKMDISVFKCPNKNDEFTDYSVQALLKVMILLNPTMDSDSIVNGLLIVQQLKRYSKPRIYMETVRASFINLNDAILDNCQSYWGPFLLIKLPQILQIMAARGSINGVITESITSEVVEGFKMLMDFSPLMNNIDTHTYTNTVEYLLTEIVNRKIISEKDKLAIVELRKSNCIDIRKTGKLLQHEQCNQLPAIILQTKQTLLKLSKSLDADFSKLQDHLIIMLSSLLRHNYEVILNFASVKGDLRLFVHKLMKVNEFSRQSTSPNDAYVKALIFDITFVVLCSIVQKYGSNVTLSNKHEGFFFETWVQDCMKEHDSNKATTALTKGPNDNHIRQLVELFKSGEFDIRKNLIPWDELCFAMPGVMKDIHDGWRNLIFSTNDVKRMLKTICSQVCCLAICSVSWLCSFMQILPQDELLQPKSIVQQFQQFMTLAAKEDEKQELGCHNILACRIMKHMQYDVSPPMMLTDVPSVSRSVINKDAVYKQIIPKWENVLQKGFLDTEAVHLFKTVLSVSVPRLFMKFMLHEILKLRFVDELNKAVDLLFALFNFNLHDCTVALLSYLPHLLFRSDSITLVEPQSTAVAKLTAYAVCAAVQTEFNCTRRRTEVTAMDIEQDIEELCPASKIVRMNSAQSGNTPMVYVSTGRGNTQLTIKDSELLKSMSTLFHAFGNITDKTGVVTPDTYFIFNVVKEVVYCGKDSARAILSRLPTTLVPNLIKSVPNLFTMDLILQLYDLNTVAGRKTAVRDLCFLRSLSLRSQMNN